MPSASVTYYILLVPSVHVKSFHVAQADFLVTQLGVSNILLRLTSTSAYRQTIAYAAFSVQHIRNGKARGREYLPFSLCYPFDAKEASK